MRLFALLTLLALPAGAFTPEELLKGRSDVFNCPEGAEVCTIKRKDAEWVGQRDALLNRLLIVAARKVQMCNPRGI